MAPYPDNFEYQNLSEKMVKMNRIRTKSSSLCLDEHVDLMNLGLNLGIAVVIFVLCISITIDVIALSDPQTPWIIYSISLIILCLEIASLIFLIRVKSRIKLLS